MISVFRPRPRTRSSTIGERNRFPSVCRFKIFFCGVEASCCCHCNPLRSLGGSLVSLVEVLQPEKPKPLSLFISLLFIATNHGSSCRKEDEEGGRVHQLENPTGDEIWQGSSRIQDFHQGFAKHESEDGHCICQLPGLA